MRDRGSLKFHKVWDFSYFCLNIVVPWMRLDPLEELKQLGTFVEFKPGQGAVAVIEEMTKTALTAPQC